MRRLIFAAPLLLTLTNFCPAPCSAQSENSDFAIEARNAVSSLPFPQPTSQPGKAPGPRAQIPSKGKTNEGLSRVGIGVKISTLGPGIEAAYQLSERLSVRGGFNDFRYGINSTNNGIDYSGTLGLRSAQASLDWFFWHSLHLSPGLLFYDGNRLNATASAGGQQSFTLNHVTYFSDPTNPLSGAGTVKFRRAGPSLMFGVGNLVPRGQHRFSISFEVGGFYQGSPTVSLNLTGRACDFIGTHCRDVATDPGIQSNIQAQQNKYNNDISSFKFWPVISLGFGFKL